MLNGGPAYGTLQGFDEVVEVYAGEGPPGSDVLSFDGRTVHMPRANEFVPLADARLARMQPDERLSCTCTSSSPTTRTTRRLEFKQLFHDERYSGPYREGRRQELRELVRPGETPAPELVEELVHLYDANVRWADHNLGLVLDVLRAHGLFDEALVVVTSDHGEAFWQHGVRGHGEHLFEEERAYPSS